MRLCPGDTAKQCYDSLNHQWRQDLKIRPGFRQSSRKWKGHSPNASISVASHATTFSVQYKPQTPHRYCPSVCSSNHLLTSFLPTIPTTLILSSTPRSRYSRMIYPHTLQTSSQVASKRSHQQLGGVEGSEICRCRVVRRMAALTIVGIAYSAYTGV